MLQIESPSRRRVDPCLACALALLPALALAQVPEYELKAEFLERFTRFVEWPAGSSVQDPATPFVIGVYGANPFGSYLSRIAASRRIKGKSVDVRLVATPEEAERCNLLFIPSGERRSLGGILARTADRPVLTVSEVDGAAEKGVLINFYVADENLRFEVNDAAVRKSRLDFSSRLLKLARVLHLEPRP